MKICPFCKEEIRDEAIKCRYCQSSLLPLQPASPEPVSPAAPAEKGKTVLIVDDGLISFGKFVAGTLAIFVTIGIFFYGIDIKESLKDVESSTQAAKSAADSVGKIEVTVQKAQDQVKSDETNATAALASSKASVAALQDQLQAVQAENSATSDAAKKALAAESKMEGEQVQFEQSRQDAAKLLAEAKTVEDDILSKKQTVDVAVAHILSISVTPGQPAKPADPAVTTSATSSSTPAKPTSDHPFTAIELAALYDFPSTLNGSGQTVGLIELGGGYDTTRLAAYFKKINRPMPNITWVGIDGGKNNPTTASSEDGEVQLDIEVVGSVAPAAKIVVYFCPNTNTGFLDGISRAIHDDTHRLSVLAISWGSPEPTATRQWMTDVNAALQDSAARTITVLVASGDSGPTDGMSNGQRAVDFPASSPWVTAVGGSRLLASGCTIESEVPWNDTSSGGASGYGVSSVFEVPTWQVSAGVPKSDQGFAGRAIPDVMADASPATGYEVEVDGQTLVMGGTAAAAPLWAAFIAILNQGLGHNIGFLNQELYAKLGPGSALHKIGPSWSPVAGWGSPDGQKLLDALRGP